MTLPNESSQELSLAVEYSIERVRELLGDSKIVALTGAGISTDSGIPDYRGTGKLVRHPMVFDEFVGSVSAQRRYWSRSFVGWNRISLAEPNLGHLALARAESKARLVGLITQNVDGLHQRAGSKRVIDLHGRLDRVVCLQCGKTVSRTDMDEVLQRLNPEVQRSQDFEFTPDGDAEVPETETFRFPGCENCGGVLKPDVVFFGETVPVSSVEDSMSLLDSAEALLVAGTSLAVNSGLRFVKHAYKAQKPVVIVNIGPTKGDELASAKIEANTSLVLERLFDE